ncbi:hypothetical protein [Salisediminibacterium halotolerans]|uniref:hypothetical protein n=1 Tax=Salisediminibacterium halotolerans TaxID=517425 RepID=UPI000EB32546|nr:hypothetical protein [Salisediminibacterium halotolerans]RLJ75620.1 hypothetical protein BCL39_1137 [Actinophytocola xinjiangensis]RPE89474.1 hypothetical protein EDD67_0250 [Salisediminibacterium halotolerans]TWG36233.1 hypothetical protein BCL52_1134 [Salisediminibacterium halotolerans]GEL08491.1 hypothetical protein SHA02_19070 [Salisediminibacterium halotolerans]
MEQLLRHILQRINGEKAELPEIDAPYAYSDENGHQHVYISAAYNGERAQVRGGKGASLSEAAESALSQMPVIKTEDVKFDVVTEINTVKQTMSWMNVLNEKISYTPREDGIILDKEGFLSFLPEEVEMYGMIRSGKLQREHMYRALRKHGLLGTPAEKMLTAEEWFDVFTFKTASYYLNDEGLHVLFRGHRDTQNEPLTREKLEQAVALTKNHYFMQVLNRQGKFVYSYDPRDQFAANRYNILRHAGTVYAMLEAYELTQDTDLLKTAEKALRYLLKRIEFFQLEGREVAAVVENDAIKLGGNGLALIALSKYTEQSNDKQYLAYMTGLAAWMQATQDETGKFAVHKQTFSTGEVTHFNSSYYPGEAILGLVRLYQLDGNETWLVTAENEADFLINRRDAEAQQDSIEHDHWLLYALNELHRERPKELYVRHSYFIAEAMFASQRTDATAYDHEWLGSYEMKGIPRSTPTACRSEGLGAVYQMALRINDHNMAEKAREAIFAGIRFQLQLQYRLESVMYLTNKTLCLGALHESLDSYDIRNDYTQHSLSSFIQAIKIITTSS